MSKREEPEAEDDDLFELEELETLPCNFTYVAVCILLPLLNGQLNAFHFSGFMLHYEDMGWPLFRAGLALSLGFGTRVFVQQLILNSGYWMAVPVGLVHLTFAILAMIYTTSEWALMAEIICILALDPTCAIEGISFDSFGASEVQARQASSTALSVWTIGAALAVTVGGIVYDTLGWRGVAAYHVICQGSLVLLLVSQPGCRKSFMATFFPKRDPEMQAEAAKKAEIAEKGEAKDATEGAFVSVISAKPCVTLPGVVEELQLEEVTEDEFPEDDLPRSGHGNQIRPSAVSNRSRHSAASHRSRHSAASQSSAGSRARPSAQSRGSHMTAGSGVTQVTKATKATGATGGTEKSDKSKGSKGSKSSAGSRVTRKTLKTSVMSVRSARSQMTFLTQISSLSAAGQDFGCHFGAKNAFHPIIAGATGKKQVARDQLDSDDDDDDDNDGDMKKPPTARARIPKDLRLPAFLIVMNAFVNNLVYALEFCTFAIFFKQVHNWNEATLASVAQTSGDLVAAIAMQVLPYFFDEEYDPDEAGCFKRLFHKMTSQPYNLSFLLATWVIFNFGMLSPLLPLAIVSQIFMGTTYVYSSKWTTDMNLFYSLGDQNVFMSLQVLCRNAEAIGGCLAGVVGTWLYTLNPAAPFIFTTGMSFLAFLMYTVGFCSRLGCDFDDIETAEEKRARKKGVRRVSSWMSTQNSRTTKVALEEERKEYQIDAAQDDMESGT